MSNWTDGARWRASGTAVLLLVAGAVLGVLADRLLLAPPALSATLLTADAMADRLDLSPAEEAQVRALLDSLHAEIVSVVQQSPDSLRMAVRHAQHRIEAALPASARAGFRAWMQEHHEDMTRRLHGGAAGPRSMHGEGSSGAHTGDPHRRP